MEFSQESEISYNTSGGSESLDDSIESSEYQLIMCEFVEEIKKREIIWKKNTLFLHNSSNHKNDSSKSYKETPCRRQN